MSAALHRRLDRIEGDTRAPLIVWRELGETEQQAVKRWQDAHPSRAHEVTKPGANVCLVSWAVDPTDLH